MLFISLSELFDWLFITIKFFHDWFKSLHSNWCNLLWKFIMWNLFFLMSENNCLTLSAFIEKTWMSLITCWSGLALSINLDHQSFICLFQNLQGNSAALINHKERGTSHLLFFFVCYGIQWWWTLSWSFDIFFEKQPEDVLVCYNAIVQDVIINGFYVML